MGKFFVNNKIKIILNFFHYRLNSKFDSSAFQPFTCRDAHRTYLIPTMPSSPWNRTAIPCFSFAQFAFDTTSQLLLKIESKYVALVNFT